MLFRTLDFFDFIFKNSGGNFDVDCFARSMAEQSFADCQARIAKTLTDADIHALTQYLAAQPMPADPHPAAALAAPAPMRCGGLTP